MKVDFWTHRDLMIATPEGVFTTAGSVSQFTIEIHESTYFVVRRTVWDTTGQSYSAERPFRAEDFWECLFVGSPIYCVDPDRMVADSLNEGWRVHCLEGRVAVYESCRRKHRAFALSFQSDYFDRDIRIAAKGEIRPVMFFQKKFDYDCRLVVTKGPAGDQGDLYAIFEEIRGVISVERDRDHFQGPLVLKVDLSILFFHFAGALHKRSAEAPPTAGHCVEFQRVDGGSSS